MPLTNLSESNGGGELKHSPPPFVETCSLQSSGLNRLLLLRLVTEVGDGAAHRLVDADDLVHLRARLFGRRVVAQADAVVAEREAVELRVALFAEVVGALEVGRGGGLLVGLARAGGLSLRLRLLDLRVQFGRRDRRRGRRRGPGSAPAAAVRGGGAEVRRRVHPVLDAGL